MAVCRCRLTFSLLSLAIAESAALMESGQKERDLNETSSESDTYSSCPSLHCMSVRLSVCQSSNTKLIQIPENPLLSSYRTNVKILVKDKKSRTRWNARHLPCTVVIANRTYDKRNLASFLIHIHCIFPTLHSEGERVMFAGAQGKSRFQGSSAFELQGVIKSSTVDRTAACSFASRVTVGPSKAVCSALLLLALEPTYQDRRRRHAIAH